MNTKDLINLYDTLIYSLLSFSLGLVGVILGVSQDNVYGVLLTLLAGILGYATYKRYCCFLRPLHEMELDCKIRFAVTSIDDYIIEAAIESELMFIGSHLVLKKPSTGSRSGDILTNFSKKVPENPPTCYKHYSTHDDRR